MWDYGDCAVVVAHPDDETLWAGGTILLHPESRWTIVTVCRASDPDRSGRFHRLCERLGALGRMGDLDDGPEQSPLEIGQVAEAILGLLPEKRYDLILTHGPAGEYTRHRRHEEVHQAVVSLWTEGRLQAGDLWTFAYEDGNGRYLPRSKPDADVHVRLSENIRRKKYGIITQTYGFDPDSFEARTTPRTESFMMLRRGDGARVIDGERLEP